MNFDTNRSLFTFLSLTVGHPCLSVSKITHMTGQDLIKLSQINHWTHMSDSLSFGVNLTENDNNSANFLGTEELGAIVASRNAIFTGS